jgi:hypothetical protein
MAWDNRGKAEGSKDTQIQKGEKRSPGRPKGAKGKKTIIEAAVQTALVNELEHDAMEIYQKAAQMAKEGDKTMIKLFLGRLLPELKATGEDESGKGTGGIQIIVNQGHQAEAKDVSDAITVNQIDEPKEDNEDG